MNTEALQYFIKVYEKKSVSLAAKDLFITPQGLSKTIKQLEMDLEAELFCRGSRGMEATECGELLYARAKHICYLMEDIKKEISIINGRKNILLTVVVTYATTSAVPPDMLFGFSNVYPSIKMKLREYPDEYPIDKLFQEQVDVGLVLGHEDIENCEYELVVPGEVVVVVSKNHPLAAKDEISIIELENEPLVIKSMEFGKQHSLVDKCLEYGFAPYVKHEMGNILAAHILCETNGYVTVSVDFIEDAVKNDKLKVIRLREKIPQNIYMVTRKRDIQSKTVTLFRSYVRQYSKDRNKSF
ncbi:LysR family transcriptional regulator [Clostridium sp. YIM B02505]|uniref:LysR family transcriptional regulator n=1 Tax=Clostridium yunnanense TaxID=2800325 RepID=A0ABS1EK86_9CLOT|nr:LysR family transcriptional regulator [Clostridium yunnanense]MBK1809771.1 LysR family transcriptional regulator [Clostridium yunnanense]